jgi:hypothetical protein
MLRAAARAFVGQASLRRAQCATNNRYAKASANAVSAAARGPGIVAALVSQFVSDCKLQGPSVMMTVMTHSHY